MLQTRYGGFAHAAFGRGHSDDVLHIADAALLRETPLGARDGGWCAFAGEALVSDVLAVWIRNGF